MLCAVGWKHGDDPSTHIQWIKQYWTADRALHVRVLCQTMRTPEHSEAVIAANYRRNHDRLVAVKNKYDPKNLFRLNANVKPTVKRA